jgi:hypothetical protein
MKRILRGVILGIAVVLLVAVPVFAYYYGSLSVVESDGNAHTSLPVIASINASQLSDYGFISATGLDTRVLTGDGYALPHMLANDKVLFVTDLAAHETKSLIFYMGATSLSSFPIIVGYNGSFTTPDDPDLELGYVMEVLISGYFNARVADIGHNILYKEDAFRVWISATNTLRVAALNSTGDEQWEMHYNNFTTGIHTVYIVCNGLHASLYVDSFTVAKDTANLFESSQTLISGTTTTTLADTQRQTFYSQGLYWAFYMAAAPNITFKTSANGLSWSGATVIEAANQSDSNKGFSVWENNGDVYIAYAAYRGYLGGSQTDKIRYRIGALASNGTIEWGAAWANAVDGGIWQLNNACIATDASGNYAIVYRHGAANIMVFVSGVSTTQVNTNTYIHSETTITGYPNSTKLFVVWSTTKGHTYPVLTGRYYNGASWSGSVETIDSEQSAYDVSQFSAIADDNNNVYVVWNANGAIYLRIRYSDGTWGDKTLVVASGSSPTVSYNDVNDCIYIVYISGNYVYTIAIAAGELTSSGIIFTPASTSGAIISAAPFGDHIGIIYQSATDKTLHAYVDFFWDWNDNSNGWVWMANNTLSYMDEAEIAVDGIVHLHYKPNDIIQGNTLPDISTASNNDADITWGTNIGGVTTSMGPLTSSSYQPAPGVTAGNWSTPQDVMPSTGGESITGGLGTLDTNVFYPIVATLSYLSGLLPGEDPIPIPLMWVLLASIILIIVVAICVAKMPHQLITALVGLGLIVLFNRMGIYPWWVYLIYVPIAVSILVYERKPAL